MNDTPEKPSSAPSKKSSLKEWLFQGFRNKIAEKRAGVDRAKSMLWDIEKKKEQAQLSADLDKSNPGVFPNPPETWTPTETKPETTSDESEKLREELGKEIGEEIKTKIESIKESRSLDVLSDEEKRTIHTEIIQQSISVSDLSEKQKTDAQASVIASLEGDTAEKKAQAWKNLSEEKQEEMILATAGVKKSTETLLTAYEEALRKPENLQDGKLKPEVLSQLAKVHLWSEAMSQPMQNALTLDVLQNSADKKLREESSMEIVSRVISEKWLQELTDTVWVENLKWSHIPPMVKLQMVGSDKFNYDKTTLFEKNPQFAESLSQAIQWIQKKLWETPEDYKKRMQQEYWLDDKAVAEWVQQLASSEGGSVDAWGNTANTSNISPFMQFLWDIFATIWAMLPGETWAMCRNYLSKSAGAAGSYAESGSWDAGRHNGTSGAGIPESTGAPGEVTGELAEMGFRWNIMDSIWKWEYQPGHKAEVVPAGSSWFTLCWGIDLAYTPFSDVQTIFVGVLKPETIQKLKPFCYTWKTGPTRWTAQNLLNSTPWLLQELNSQFTEENMPTAFSRSLAKDWARLVKKYPSAANAPGYMQTIMLSRFYHDGSGWSSDIISAMVKSNFDHSATVNLLQSRRGRRSASYYRNRIDKEIAYVGKRPPDALQKKNGSANTDSQTTNNSGTPTSIPESTSTSPTNSAVNWFRENNGKPYGWGEGKYDCMSSTHAALGINISDLDAPIFWSSDILRDGERTDLWNVSMAAARYSGILGSVRSPKKWIQQDKSGYYGGVDAQSPSNMEYHIEENVMKRVASSSSWIIDVWWNGKLVHYSKRNGTRAIYDDILRNNRLEDGQVAMMGATGRGTNIGGHEWLLSREWDKLKVYESTNYEGKWVSWTWVDLLEYLDHNRRSQYAQEALIFAKK
jgi:hypothetical protein